jgi:hypothetical protein
MRLAWLRAIDADTHARTPTRPHASARPGVPPVAAAALILGPLATHAGRLRSANAGRRGPGQRARTAERAACWGANTVRYVRAACIGEWGPHRTGHQTPAYAFSLAAISNAWPMPVAAALSSRNPRFSLCFFAPALAPIPSHPNPRRVPARRRARGPRVDQRTPPAHRNPTTTSPRQ